MAAPVAHVEAKVGDRVTYHGTVIVAHGNGRITAVHDNGRVDIRVDIRVDELSYALEQRGRGWAEVPYRGIRNVRPESFKPYTEEDQP